MELNKNIARGLATFAVKYMQLAYGPMYDGKPDAVYRNGEILKGIVESFRPKISIHSYNYDGKGNGSIIIKNNLDFVIYEFYFNNFKISEE